MPFILDSLFSNLINLETLYLKMYPFLLLWQSAKFLPTSLLLHPLPVTQCSSLYLEQCIIIQSETTFKARILLFCHDQQ